jgi:capsular polysaccharide biosynthesis protein
VDLNLYFRVLWRFRLIVAVGFVLAITVAFASVAKVGADGSISYRQQQTWQGTTRLFVTQRGFPWGRTVLPGDPTSVPATSTSSGTQFADPNRLAALSEYYAALINGDLIQRQIRKRVRDLGLLDAVVAVPPGSVLSATAVTDPTTNAPLALVDVTSVAHTPAQAALVSRAGANLFRSDIAHQQTSAGIAAKQRVLLQVVSTKATLIAGRKKTLAIVAFLAVLIATIALTFVLENQRPRIQAVAPVTAVAPAERVDERQTGS